VYVSVIPCLNDLTHQ